MSAWVTDSPNWVNGRAVSLSYRFLVAMQGALGIGSNLNKWTDEDFALAGKMVALDKRIRATVQNGDLYRLFSPRTGDLTANQYVGPGGRQAVLFAFRHSQQYNTPVATVRLRGLDPRAMYRIESIDGKLVEKQPQLSGAYLMEAGLNVNLRGDFDSTAVVLERID
jgi:alpha-galactosidase